MSDRLGVIRVGLIFGTTQGPFFDFTYDDEQAFDRAIAQIRSDGHLSYGNCYIPERTIAYVIKIPQETKVEAKVPESWGVMQ